MKVLSDFHHAGLLNSLILLFENRLGGELYRPIGKEWFEQGFWKVYDHPATVEQYLGINGATPDGTAPLNDVVLSPTAEVYHCKDIVSSRTNKAITLDGFFNKKFDVLIASIPQHIEPFKRLASLHPNQPKVIYQIGNNWQPEAGLAKNIMASARVDSFPKDLNIVEYHQEFPLDVFYPDFKHEPANNIYSFVNCFNLPGIFTQDWGLFLEVERLMPDYCFKSFGGACRDGSANGEDEVAQKMREAKFIWHTKNGGDGYGHVFYNTGAVARPMIVKAEYYKGKLGEELLEDGVTCISIDGLRLEEIVTKVNYYAEVERYKRMCQNIYSNFTQKVNFEEEAKKLQNFVNNLL